MQVTNALIKKKSSQLTGKEFNCMQNYYNYNEVNMVQSNILLALLGIKNEQNPAVS